MKKQQSENEKAVAEATMSRAMLEDLKKEISKFGFRNEDYVKFLISVYAMKNEDTVMSFPNSDINAYREKVLKKFEHSFGDSFQLEKFKIMSSTQDGKKYETGYFCPRSFWDFVRDAK